MWLLRRLFPPWRRRATGSVAGLAPARAYGRWLDHALTGLAETLLLATPYAPTLSSRNPEQPARHALRVQEAREQLAYLLAAARQREPPAALEVFDAASAHLEYVALIEQSARAMDALGRALACLDEGAIRMASAELKDVSTAAARLHGRVIEWALPLLIGIY